MLILAKRNDFPDHPMPEVDRYRKGEDTRISDECPWTWWWDCDHVDKAGKTKVKCSRLHRISCDGGVHISLEVAEVALRHAGWRQADDGGWRCPRHKSPVP